MLKWFTSIPHLFSIHDTEIGCHRFDLRTGLLKSPTPSKMDTDFIPRMDQNSTNTISLKCESLCPPTLAQPGADFTLENEGWFERRLPFDEDHRFTTKV
jgi:hypothetical protein